MSTSHDSKSLVDELDGYEKSVASRVSHDTEALLLRKGMDLDLKFNSLKEEILSLCKHLDDDLTPKFSMFKEELLPFCHATIDKYLGKKEVDIDFDAIASECIDRKIHDSIAPAIADLRDLRDKQSRASNDITDLKSSINFLFDDTTNVDGTPPSRNDILLLEKRIRSFSTSLTAMQSDLDAKNKRLNTLDLKTRELNLLIDGMFELAKEDTISYVCNLLVKFIPHFNRHWIDNAYRLGKPAPNKAPRRILLTVSSYLVRERILECAKSIADAGTPGARIFINEDIPEPIKRRRSDVFKYVDFLKKKGIQATQKGDGVIFNNTLYRYEELLHMSDGFSQKDSRTTRKNGVLAFQSPHSPLSNLFVAPIKRNGIVYPSAEHVYQHSKAIFCNELALAQTILDNPCPFEAMATGKRVPINKNWQAIQLSRMEEVLRLKLEQVPAFAAELKASDNHYLVENTRSHFWGSGTP